MGRPRTRDFGPSIQDTIEVGDLFFSNQTKKVIRITRKIYNEDLTIFYEHEVVESPEDKRPYVRAIHENSFKNRSTYRVVYRVPRRVLETEKTFTGVFYGRS